MKTAVILAARREKDSEIPYPLMPFAEGLCLLIQNLLSWLMCACVSTHHMDTADL